MSCKMAHRLLILLIVISCTSCLISAHEHSHDGGHHHHQHHSHEHFDEHHGHSHDEVPSFKYSRQANEENKAKANHHGHSHNDHEEVPKTKPLVSTDTLGYFLYMLFSLSRMSFSYH